MPGLQRVSGAQASSHSDSAHDDWEKLTLWTIGHVRIL